MIAALPANMLKLNGHGFCCQCSSEEDIPYQAEIDKIANEHTGLRVIYSLSQPTKSGMVYLGV